MRQLTRMLTRLYPPSWRIRYEAEFNALLEDVSPSWRTALNVLLGALAMQLGTRDLRRTVAFAGLIGLLTGGVCWLVIPNQYRSTATIEVQASDRSASGQFVSDYLKVLTRYSLAEIIHRYNVYPAKRAKMRIEDVIADMEKIVQVREIDGRLLVQFDYNDPVIAQSVTNDRAARFVEKAIEVRFNSGSTGIRQLRILNSGAMSSQPISPNPVSLAVIGLLSGITFGLAVALVRGASVSHPLNPGGP